MVDYVREFKRRKLELLQRKEELQSELPHLYGWPWYKWAWEFFTNTKDDTQILCAANQISKSSTQIRKCIEWATNQELWPELWGRKPNMFWYLYPSKDVATAEFEKKWKEEFMPRGSMVNDLIYGWKAIYDKKHIVQINFNSGVTVYFKTYMQDPKTLQSGSVYAMFTDEELPEHLYDELQFRLAGTNGYFHMVFTATLGQEMWWRAMEAIGSKVEFLKDAWKKTVSMYDCLEYIDGSPSPWTVDRIKKVEAKCKSNNEIKRRVHGRFIKEEGRTVHQFDPSVHYIEPFDIPPEWPRYCGVDIGSGGETGHPSSICFVAVKPDYKMGYVYKLWRGDNIKTSAGDVYEKFKEMQGKYEHFTRKTYDFSAADFGTIATRLGESFEKANKSHTLGNGTINTLLKNKMLMLFNTEGVRKLGSEWMSLQISTPKTKAKDDAHDSCRYGVVEIPWDFSDIKSSEGGQVKVEKYKKPVTIKEWDAYHLDQRRARFDEDKKEETPQDWGDLEDEFGYWNESYGN